MNVRRCGHVGVAGLAAVCCALVFAGLAPAGASALAGSAAWSVSAVAKPANFVAGDHSGKDFFEVTVTNTGDAPSDGSTVTIADVLAHGLVAAGPVSGHELLNAEELSCSGLSCSYGGVVASGDTLTLTVPVNVEPTAQSGEDNIVTVSGGDVREASASTPLVISPVFPGFGVAPGSFATSVSSVQAGAHADLTTSFDFNSDAAGGPEGQAKDVSVDLPAGFAGDPAAVQTCSAAQLNEPPPGANERFSSCPLDSQVGTITVALGFRGFVFPVVSPVYNMQPLGGEVARLGFKTAVISNNIVITVRPGSYGLEATAPNLDSGTLEVLGSKLTVWGVPALASHDLMRGTTCELTNCSGPPGPGGATEPIGAIATIPAQPFLSNPTGCGGSLTSTIKVDTWQNPLGAAELSEQAASSPSAEDRDVGPLSGCERLEFNPSLTIAPTSSSAESATGLNVGVTLPQTYENPAALATSHLRDATVTLPEGMTVNPSAGAGLSGCAQAQFAAEALETPAGAGCPNSSTLGTVSIHTPVLKEEATGSVFLAQPYANPFSELGHPEGSLLALYVVARIPNRGVIVKLAGRITPDPITGRLTTVFEDNPQLPFDRFTLKFNPGQAAPLVTPAACDAYSALGQFTSWSEPEALVSTLSPSSEFAIGQGVGGGGCPSGSVPPFNPQVISGTLSNAAGSYSQFDLRIIRGDGEQELTRFSTVLPPGLTGNLSGIPFCPDADIEAAKAKTGARETAEPSCPAASEIGHTSVGAGVGPVLAQAPGKVYLAGPYHGAPLSIVSVTSATVGPFDLGTVVIRFALRINPITAQVEVDAAGSDPIPHIIRGIVVHVRDIHVYIDRPGFIENPTSCEHLQIQNAIEGANGGSASLTSPFQAADCQSLRFEPAFRASVTGKATKAAGAGLKVNIAYPNTPQGTQANIHAVKVELPVQLPSRLTTLQKACLASVFEANPANCPAASVVGHAMALTPILPVPLAGPAYFVSYGSAKFPELVIVLQGYGITIVLHGETFISKKGITSSTFHQVPDEPVTSFELTLPQGSYSALAANGNLCGLTHTTVTHKTVTRRVHGHNKRVRVTVVRQAAATSLKMPTEITAQNGVVIHLSTPIGITGCGQVKNAKKKVKARRHGSSKGKSGKGKKH